MAKKKLRDAEGGEPLLLALGPLIDDSMLVEIASADYHRDIAKHLAALRPIRDQGLVPYDMEWEPEEVLELTRWIQPEQSNGLPNGQEERDHLMRAFACGALLAGGRFKPNRLATAGYCDTVLNLIGSLEALNLPLHVMAADLIGAVVEVAETDEFELIELLMMQTGRLRLLFRGAANVDGLSLAVDQAKAIITAMQTAALIWPNNIGEMHYNTLYEESWREMAKTLPDLIPETLAKDLADAIREVAEVLALAD